MRSPRTISLIMQMITQHTFLTASARNLSYSNLITTETIAVPSYSKLYLSETQFIIESTRQVFCRLLFNFSHFIYNTVDETPVVSWLNTDSVPLSPWVFSAYVKISHSKFLHPFNLSQANIPFSTGFPWKIWVRNSWGKSHYGTDRR